MKIEKGKLYYDRVAGLVLKADMTMARDRNTTRKVAVECLSEDDVKYVKSKIDVNVELFNKDNAPCDIYLDTYAWDYFKNRQADYRIISIDKFKEFYPAKEPLDTDVFASDTIGRNVFDKISGSIADLLKYKNEKYGNSALEPLDIFQGKTKVGQRLDDKLARVKNSKELKKNDVADLIGYLTLVCVENDWTDFSEFKD